MVVWEEASRVAEVKSGGIGAWIRNVPIFVNQVRAETAKVVWPTRRETVMTAVMVVVMTALLGIFLFGVDLVFKSVVQELLKLVRS